ncbi:MAG: ABC transporter ATP-binding protein [Myxococcota bacterium]
MDGRPFREAELVSTAAPPEVLLEADALGKRFDIYPNDRSRFFELVGSRTHHVEHWALKGLSFQVRRGRAFGVIGSNGAGKSTLLRLLAGITEPTEGSVGVYGRMATLLDLGVGFHDTFTGRENIQLTCSLLGMDPAKIQERIPEIIRFAELGDFIDYPVRTYSTGMNLRLGFSIAMHADAEILLIDEVLAVGDQYFQRKCVRRIEQAVRDGATLVLVSHDLHAVRSLCDEVLWLDRGRPRVIGPPREVIERYLELDRLRVAPPAPDAPARPALRPVPGGTDRVIPLPSARVSEEDPALREVLEVACAVPDAAGLFAEEAGDAPRKTDGDTMVVAGTGEARILRVQLLDPTGHERERFRTGESLVVAVTFRTTEPLVRPIFGVALFRSDGVYVFGPNTRFDGVLDGTYHGVYTFFVHYPKLPLLVGTYRVSVAIFDQGHVSPHVWHNQLYSFEVAQDVEDHGLVQIPHRWGMITWHTPPSGEGGS